MTRSTSSLAPLPQPYNALPCAHPRPPKMRTTTFTTTLLFTCTSLLSFVSSQDLMDTRKWVMKTLQCKGTPDDVANWWLSTDQDCTILKRKIYTPFVEMGTTYNSICCKARIISVKKHPTRVVAACGYSPLEMDAITGENNCLQDTQETGSCVTISAVLERHADISELPGCDVSDHLSIRDA